MLCPVVATINEIKGAGWYAADDSDDVVVLGGSDSTQYVCDEMSFYMTTRKMDLARFELKRPSVEEYAKFYARGYSEYADITYSEMYTKLIDRALKKKLLYAQFVDLVTLISDMEDLILSRVEAAGRAGQSINVSLPDIILLPHIDSIIIYRADALEKTINKIISYINKINVNSLIKDPVAINVAHVRGFDAKMESQTVIPGVHATTADEYLAGIKMMLEHEIKVAEYIRELEKYQCYVINHLNQVYDICKKIISLCI